MVIVKAAPKQRFHKKMFNYIINHEFRVYMFILFLYSMPIVITTVFLKGYCDGNFLSNLLSEAHGAIFDLLIVGVLINLILSIRDKRLKVKGYCEDIDDHRNWNSPYAAHKIKGVILRLNKLRITKVDLRDCYLEGMELSNINLSGSNLIHANFKQTKLIGIKLDTAFLINSNFNRAEFIGGSIQNSICQEANFKDANLLNVSLKGSDLVEVDMQNADLNQANLKDVNFTKANLYGVKNVTIEQLSKAATLWKAKLNRDIKKELKKRYTHLFEEPNKIK